MGRHKLKCVRQLFGVILPNSLELARRYCGKGGGEAVARRQDHRKKEEELIAERWAEFS